MSRLSDLSRDEIAEKIASGEIDVNDLVEIDWTGVHFKCDEPDSDVPVKPTKYQTMADINNPQHFLVKIRLNNGRTYELAKIPSRPDMDIEDHEAEVFHYFFQKLNKRFVHVRTPIHRAIKTSKVDELFVERVP